MNLINERTDKVSDLLLGLEPEEHPLKHHCRFCLKNTKGMPYTTLFTSAGLNHFLREKIEKCVDVKLLKEDKEIANRICITCSKHLDRAYRFAVRYEDSQRKLEEIILVINEKLSKPRHHQQYKTNILNSVEKVNGEEFCEQIDINEEFNGNNNTCLVIVNGGGHNTTQIADSVEDEARRRISIPSQIRKPVFDDNLYECQICFCVFTNKRNIHTHMKKHSSVLLNNKELFQNDQLFQKYLDGLCTESDVKDIISKIVLRTEVNSTSQDETIFNRCQLCPAVLATKSQLSKHIQQHCETDNSIAYQAQRAQDENKHSSLMEEIESPLASLELSVQSEVHANEMRCRICDKFFHSSKRFDTHMKRHLNSHVPRIKGKPNRIFQCNDCDKVFNSKVSIRKHVTVHLSKTKKQLYACNICGKEYISLVARESHKLKHDPFYEFSCEFCPKKFKLKKLLKEHIRIHTRKNNYSQRQSYSCTACDVKFLSLEDLEFHKDMTHKHNEGNLDCNLDIEEFEKYNDFTEVSLNNNELMKIESEEYNEQLSEDFKDIEVDILKAETEDIDSDEMEALNMDSFCDELYLSNEEDFNQKIKL